jgi:putative FmdB family regulatory protein
MPVYEYQCLDCNHIFSQFFFTLDTGVVCCPVCQSQHLKKLISQIGNVNKKGSTSSCESCSSGNCSSCHAE